MNVKNQNLNSNFDVPNHPNMDYWNLEIKTTGTGGWMFSEWNI